MRILASPKTGPRRKPRVAFIPVLILALATVGHADEVKQRFDIDAGNAAPKINEFGLQANLQLLGDFKLMSRVTTHAVHGEYTPKEALDKMLAGTGLRYRFIDEETLNILAKDIEPAPEAVVDSTRTATSLMDEVTVSGTHIRGDLSPVGARRLVISRKDIDRSGLATVADVLRTLPQNFGGGPTEDTREIGRETLTNSGRGTALNLRGLGPGETLVLLDGRRLAPGGSEGAFIDISSVPLSAVDHIDVLPDNGPALYGADAIGGVINIVLRHDESGVESQARAGTGTQGGPSEVQFSQTLTTRQAHGSALLAFEYYRHDALPTADRSQSKSDLRPFGGGNFDVLQGNPGTIIAGGLPWAIPSGQDGTALKAEDLIPGTRNLEDRYAGADLTPRQPRWSLLGTARYAPSANVSLFADALFSRRDPEQKSSGARLNLLVSSLNPFYVNPAEDAGPIFVAYDFRDDLGPIAIAVAVKTANLAVGADINIGAGWRLSNYVGYAREKLDLRQTGQPNLPALMAALMDPSRDTAFNPFGDGSHTNPQTLASLRTVSRFSSDSGITTLNMSADGPLVQLPGGSVKLAWGADFRHQTFASRIQDINTAPRFPIALSHDVAAAFGEVLVPLGFPKATHRGLRNLDLSIAARFEDPNDIGSTTTPKIGLRWSPTADITLRGTWTESFRAPNLADLFEGDNSSAILPLFDPASLSEVPTLVWTGKNANLRPETARSTTLGIDVAPRWFTGWQIAMTWFDIRIRNQFSEFPFGIDALTDPRFANVTSRDPTIEQRRIVCARSQFIGSLDDCLNAHVSALIDARLSSSAFTRTSGFDLGLHGEWNAAVGHLDVDLNGTYLLHYAEQETPELPLVERLNTQNNPLRLRMRGSASWQRTRFGATAFVNYDGSYRDIASQPTRNVRSWITLDTQLRYDIGAENRGALNDTRVSLNVQNLFDRNPPFLNNALGLGYDAENADLLGRVVNLELLKKW